MVSYHQDRSPGLTAWAGTNLSATVQLDHAANSALTNLDVLSGKCTVRCSKSTDIATIVVKLEGETRTRLMAPQGAGGEKPKPQLEYHKILYQVKTVFPPSEVAQSRNQASSKGGYTLPPGQHEYPFSFKIPFNNQCWSDKSPTPIMLGLEMARPAPHHLKTTLPPTISGFPGECEIRYFVKVTVNRQSLFKENPRAFAPFNFFPVEPPRPRPTGSEIFARQRHQFLKDPSPNPLKPKLQSLFGGASSKPKPSSLTPSSEPPFITLDARLPDPAILTCNRSIPLRLILTKLSRSRDMIFLRSLQISLLGSTKLRAHDVYRTETQSWILLTNPAMNIPLGSATDPAGAECVVDDSAWRNHPLPNTVAPSFQTCNIERTYQLDIRVGLAVVRSADAGLAKQPQSILLPLRLDVRVFSGLAPPPEALSRIAAAHPRPPTLTTTPLPATSPPRKTPLSPSSHAVPAPAPVPVPEAGAGFVAEAEPPSYADAPPSYEDAVAADLPPLSAPRPAYHPPPPRAEGEAGSEEGAV